MFSAYPIIASWVSDESVGSMLDKVETQPYIPLASVPSKAAELFTIAYGSDRRRLADELFYRWNRFRNNSFRDNCNYQTAQLRMELYLHFHAAVAFIGSTHFLVSEKDGDKAIESLNKVYMHSETFSVYDDVTLCLLVDDIMAYDRQVVDELETAELDIPNNKPKI